MDGKWILEIWTKRVKMLSFFRSKLGGTEAVGDRLSDDAQLLLRGPRRLPHVLPLLRLGRPRAQVLRSPILPPSETRLRLASHRAEVGRFSEVGNFTELVWCASVLLFQLRTGNTICPKASNRYFSPLSAFGIETQCKCTVHNIPCILGINPPRCERGRHTSLPKTVPTFAG